MSDSDFSKLFEASLNNTQDQFQQGERVTGTITLIGKSTVFVDLGRRSDGILDRKDLLDANGELKYKVGDKIDAFCMDFTTEGIKLGLRISGQAVDSSIQDAFDNHIPVEGKVTGERKGGFTVQVASSEGFCPFSQIDARGVKKEPAEYIGQTYSFVITELSEEGRNLVLSRRRLLDEEAAKMRDYLKDMLKVGDIREGVVVKVMPFGAFVDLGGLQGLVPVSEISWTHGVNAEEALSVNQPVTVKILNLEWGDENTKERITLSIKQATKSPWEKIRDDESNYAVGAKLTGKVVRLADFGVFVELEPGVDGLAHISQLGQEERVEKVEDVCKVGDMVEVTILGIDPDRNRISLCFGEPKVKDEKPAALNAEQEAEIINATMGERLTGEVESLKPFGVFIKLPNGQTGLLHVSQTGIEESGPARSRELIRKFPLHSSVEVIIKEISGNRISLTLPEMLERELEKNTINDYKDEGGADFGGLNDLFGNIKL